MMQRDKLSDKRISIIFLFFLFFLFVNGCSKNDESKEARIVVDKEIIVSVSILPQKYFVEKIGGNKVYVNTLIPNGASPALYEPNPVQMKELEKSTIYFKVGHPNFPFEKRFFGDLSKNKKKLLSVDMFLGANYRKFKNDHHHDHDHDNHEEELGEHNVNSDEDNEIHTDSHVWTSPENVKLAALNIYETLSKVDIKNRNYFKKNYDNFLKEISSLQERINKIFEESKNRKFLVFHPSWGYFADEFDLEQISVEIDGKQPSAKSLLDVIKVAKENYIKVVFVQEGFSKSSANVIAKELNASVITISPLKENWLENLESVANKIRN